MKSITILLGHLGQDVECKSSTKGEKEVKYANFSVAVKRYVGKGKDPETMWHNVTCFGHNAEYLGQYAKKGMVVQVIGELVREEYTGDDGTKVSWNVKASEISLVGKIEKREATPKAQTATASASSGDEESLPF